jgi:hypothetical protein
MRCSEGRVVFSATQILLSAAVGALGSLVLVWVYGRWSKEPAFGWVEAIGIAVIVGLSILLWRAAANIPSLNDDQIPLVSPNDVLCPLLTYVSLGLYAELRRPVQARADWPFVRALLTILSFAVNVVTI